MLEIKRIEMFLGDSKKEVVLVTAPDAKHVFEDERKFHLEVKSDGEVTMKSLEGEEDDS